MTHSRGEVWWGPAPHKSSSSYRPWTIVSDDSHPFSETECIVLGMSTKRHAESIAVPQGTWKKGGSKKDAYVSPWYVMTMKLRDFDRKQGELEERVVAEAVEKMHAHTSA